MNGTNNVIATYAYDAWGNCKVYNSSGVENTSSTWVGNINPIRYRGYYYDVETELYWVSHVTIRLNYVDGFFQIRLIFTK